MDARRHWEEVYGAKKPTEVSWYQREAAVSLGLIRRAAPDRSMPIIYCLCRIGGDAGTR